MTEPLTPPSAPARRPWYAPWLLALSCANLAALCCVSYLLYVVSETWWVGAVLTYAPRMPYLAPTILLLLASLFWRRDLIGVNLVSAGIVLVPIMGLSLPLELWLSKPVAASGQLTLKVVSCNVQSFQPNFDRVLEEIAAISPDIVALQETFRGDPRLDDYFRDWHTLRHGHYFVGSRFPLTLITDCEVEQFGERTAGMMVEIDTPGGPIVVTDIHQMTARFGLKNLKRSTIVSLDGTKELEAYENERYRESADLRAIVDANRGDHPMIVCGDFNTPVSSHLFQKYWGDLQSSFDLAGFGYGYTSPCKGNRFWPDNWPWARIDHILCTREFSVRHCQIGVSDGSDHRLITATLVLKPSRR